MTQPGYSTNQSLCPTGCMPWVILCFEGFLCVMNAGCGLLLLHYWRIPWIMNGTVWRKSLLTIPVNFL